MEILETKVGIRKFREKMQVSQTELAEKLDILQSNVSAWEIGRSTPSFEIAKKLFEMGITVEELFGIEYEKMHGYAKIEAANNDLLLQILKELTLVKSDVSELKGKKQQMARAG